MEEIVNNNKFSKLNIPDGTKIKSHSQPLEKNYLITQASKEILDKSTYKSIIQVGSRPGILYVSGKINKETGNGLPPFYPILAAVDKPT